MVNEKNVENPTAEASEKEELSMKNALIFINAFSSLITPTVAAGGMDDQSYTTATLLPVSNHADCVIAVMNEENSYCSDKHVIIQEIPGDGLRVTAFDWYDDLDGNNQVNPNATTGAGATAVTENALLNILTQVPKKGTTISGLNFDYEITPEDEEILRNIANEDGIEFPELIALCVKFADNLKDRVIIVPNKDGGKIKKNFEISDLIRLLDACFCDGTLSMAELVSAMNDISAQEFEKVMASNSPAHELKKLVSRYQEMED